MPEPKGNTPGEVVRRLVREIPPGRAATYGTIGRAAVALGWPIGGARTVAWVLAALRGGEEVPWHRVVGSGGVILLKDRRGAIQRRCLRTEGVRFVRGIIPAHYLITAAELISKRLGRSAPLNRSLTRSGAR